VSLGEFYVNIDECRRLQPSRGAGAAVSFHLSFPLCLSFPHHHHHHQHMLDDGEEEDGGDAAKGDKSSCSKLFYQVGYSKFKSLQLE
ncbi:Hypothetical predicted protein, partial [Scomber scombrus]